MDGTVPLRRSGEREGRVPLAPLLGRWTGAGLTSGPQPRRVAAEAAPAAGTGNASFR